MRYFIMSLVLMSLNAFAADKKQDDARSDMDKKEEMRAKLDREQNKAHAKQLEEDRREREEERTLQFGPYQQSVQGQ